MRRPNVPTLEDVARAAGVSVSTASRALSGKAVQYRISKATVERVEVSANELGFKPSIVARSLRFQRTGLVGVIVPDITNFFFAEVARRVTLAAEDKGYSIIIADSREQTSNEVRLIRELYDRQVEGLVVCPVGLECNHLLDFYRCGLPIVLVDRVFPDTGITSVSSEQFEPAYQLTKSILAAGHQNIGVIAGLRKTFPCEQRMLGVLKAIEEARLDAANVHIVGDAFSQACGYRGATEILSRGCSTAIIALSNQITLGALRAILKSNLQLGKDIALASFDRDPLFDYLSYPIASAEQQIAKIADRAAQLILEKIQDLDPESSFHDKSNTQAPNLPSPQFTSQPSTSLSLFPPLMAH